VLFRSPFVLGLTAHLAGHGYPAPQPLARADGITVGRLNDRPAALIGWLPGDWLRAPSSAEFSAAGECLAALHLASADYSSHQPNRFGPSAWRELASACAAAVRAPYAPLTEALNAAITTLTDHWPPDLPSGPIHGDYFPDNVLFTDGAVSGVIDYYFACTDARAYDLAIAINAWCFDEAGQFHAEASAAFCAGYASRRPLSGAERAALPTLCAGAGARFTASRLYDQLHADPNALVTLKDPQPFAERLRFHLSVDDAAVYGA